MKLRSLRDVRPSGYGAGFVYEFSVPRGGVDIKTVDDSLTVSV